jgi:E3 ubiquitin-protein ligase BRE1
LRIDLEAMSTQCAHATGKLAVKDLELGKVVQRSEELADELAAKREEIRKLNGKFEESEQEAKRVRERLAGADPMPTMNGDAVDSVTFSVEDLQTQVKFLKNRLACPVCHYRDKECIIMRCRHMHCKQCVEERVSNRSRKCPTCNLKFSENDVQDVWLA